MIEFIPEIFIDTGELLLDSWVNKVAGHRKKQQEKQQNNKGKEG